MKDIMDKITLQKSYRLSELITIVANAITANGIDKTLNYKDMNFCVYAKENAELASAELTCYTENYPYISDEDEEIYPDFVTEKELEILCSGENLEDVILNLLCQKSQPSMDDFVAGLNYYMKHDTFLTL